MHKIKQRIINFVLVAMVVSSCQTMNVIPTAEDTPIPASTVASILSTQEALLQMYGDTVVLHGYSDQSDASITTGELTYNIRINMLNCYWEVESEIAVEKCLVITEKSSNYGGHPETALIDAAVFDRSFAGGWKIRYSQSNMIQMGSFGQIPKGELIQIGRQHYAALLKGVYGNLGSEMEQLVMIAETKDSLGIIFQTISSQSKMADGALSNGWGYNARLTFQMGDYNQEYYYLLVRYYGTAQDGTTPPLKSYTYIDPQYVTEQ